MLDAIQLQDALEEHVARLHTLVRLLWVVLQLAAPEPPPHLDRQSRIYRLSSAISERGLPD